MINIKIGVKGKIPIAYGKLALNTMKVLESRKVFKKKTQNIAYV